MKHLRYFGAAALAALAIACSGPENFVIEKYFQAVNAKDNDTLTSFALVPFDKKVDKYQIKRVVSETKDVAPLAELVKKQKAIEAQLADNTRAYKTYNLDHTAEVTDVRNAKKAGDPIPAKLSAVAADWDRFTDKDKELKKQLADAKSVVDKEKKAMGVSVGGVDDMDGLQGDVITKQVELELVIAGQPQAYLMTLKKYEVKSANGAHPNSRWIVSGLQKA
jgi:hypothetical protein